MKKSVAEKWVAALRSKKYTQGKKVLKSKSPRGVVRHCCLGVLCELYQQDRRAKKMKPMSGGSFKPAEKYDDGVPAGSLIYDFDERNGTASYATLPLRVVKWAGMASDDGQLVEDLYMDNGHNVQTLAELNDSGTSFSEIADVIESRVKEL